MPSTPPEMTAAEFAVMKALWSLGQATVSEVRSTHAALFGSDLAYTTVMTLLGRLASKGAVKVDKRRQPFVYKPAYRRELVLRERLKHFVDNVFDGQADALVLHLVEDEALTSDDFDRIRAQLDELERKQEDGE